MALLPISTTRVSDPLRNQRLQGQLNADQVALQRSFDQLSTGLRVMRVSDDPAAAGRAITLQRGISHAQQLSRNAGVTESFYAATESALANLGDSLIGARGATVEAAQNILSPQERDALAHTVSQAITAAVNSANTMFREHQLLGGHLQSGNALRIEGGGVVFSGTETIGQTHIGGGTPVAIGVSGTDALGLAGTIAGGPSLSAALDLATPLADVRQGRGVQGEIIRVSDGGNWVEVDLRAARSMGDVAQSLQSLSFSGRTLDVTVLPDGLSIAYADGLGGTLAIDDLPGGRMAKDLAIRNMAGQSPSPVIATDLAPRLTNHTPLSQLLGGAGLDAAAGIQIRQGDQTFVVDLSAAQNVGEVLVAINRSGADVQAEIDASGLGLAIRGLRSGVDYGIGENGGSVAGDLGIRTATDQTRLDQLNRGFGVFLSELGPDLIIQRTDGSVLELELEGAQTIADVLDLIGNHPDNQDAFQVVASLNAQGNGITLTAPDDSEPLIVRQGHSSNAAQVLGLVPRGQFEAVATSDGTVARLIGSDYSPAETGGTIDTLMRLEQAIRNGDIEELGRLQQRMDADRDKATIVRGKVGLWTQNLQQLRETAEDSVISLRSQLSEEIDADLATVISEISSRQTAQEASLRVIAQTSRLSLLDFL